LSVFLLFRTATSSSN